MGQKVRILKTDIDNLTQSEVVEKIGVLIAQKKLAYIVTANAEITYMAQNDAKMQQIINQADIVTADGSGVVWAAKELGEPLKERVTGIDLIYAICEKAAQEGWQLYLLGAADGIAAEAAEKLVARYNCRIIGAHNGFLKDPEVNDAVMEELRAKAPQVVLVGMGAPRQEYWITEHMHKLPPAVYMGVGGSFDVISGNLKRAPLWMQKMSLEWLYRVIKQPSRFKRVLALPKFMLAVKKQKRKK